MNLQLLSNQELHESAIESASHARLATTALLLHLCEVQRRRAFAEFGCESLFSYCVKHLGMDNPEAARHVNTARLMTEFPEVEEKINSCSMSLTSASQTQSFFKREARAKTPVSKEKKREILEKIENKSTREVETILRAHSSNPERDFVEKVRMISESLTEVMTAFDNETIEDLNRLKEIWSHSMPGAKYSDIIRKAVWESRERHDPLSKAERAMERRSKAERKPMAEQKTKAEAMSKGEHTVKAEERASHGNSGSARSGIGLSNRSESPGSKDSDESQTAIVTPSESLVSEAGIPFKKQDNIRKTSSAPNQGKAAAYGRSASKAKRDTVAKASSTPDRRSRQSTRTRYIHSSVRHTVWMRDCGCCTYVDPRTGERCRSRYHLQYDHVIPHAMGGKSSVENLRLRCRSHNQLHAIQTYGIEVLKYARF